MGEIKIVDIFDHSRAFWLFFSFILDIKTGPGTFFEVPATGFKGTSYAFWRYPQRVSNVPAKRFGGYLQRVLGGTSNAFWGEPATHFRGTCNVFWG